MLRRGVLLTLGAALVESICVLGVKETSVPAGELSFISCGLLVLFTIPLIWSRGDSFFIWNDLPFLVCLTLFGECLVISANYAVRLMPMADETLLAYTSVAFTVLFARIFLAESCDPRKVSASSAILFGVVLIMGRPVGDYPQYAMGCSLALFASICDAVCYIILKKLCHLHFSIIVFNMSLMGLLVTWPMYLFEDWVVSYQLLGLSVLSSVKEVLLVAALATDTAGMVCIVHATDIVFSYIWELCFFNEEYTLSRLGGSLLISFAVIFTSIYEEDVVKTPPRAEFRVIVKEHSNNEITTV